MGIKLNSRAWGGGENPGSTYWLFLELSRAYHEVFICRWSLLTRHDMQATTWNDIIDRAFKILVHAGFEFFEALAEDCAMAESCRG